MKDRRAMIEIGLEVTVRRQCELLRVGRSSVYYEPQATSSEQLEIMRRMDAIHLKWPFYGSRKITQTGVGEGREVNRKRVQRLMRWMDISAIAPKPDTSRAAAGHPIYPYLLKNLKIDRVDQVWASDITYIPLAHGFVYLVAILDWYSRRVLSWRLSTSLESDFCVEALEEALLKFGQPEIFNTDQGSQFTAEVFTEALLKRGIRVSMDGTGRYIDNIFVERLWRSVKYEEVYLHAYDSVAEARAGIGHYLRFYNEERVHQALGYQTPEIFYDGLVPRAA